MPFDPKDFENDDVFKKYVADQLAAATKPLEDSKSGLQKDITKLKDQLKGFEGVDVEALKQTAEEFDKLTKQQQEKETDAQKALRLQKEQHEKDMKELRESVDLLMRKNKTLLVDENLKGSLAKAGVKPTLLDAALQILKPQVSVLTEDGQQVARIGDKTIGEGVADWTETEVGKHFIAAKVNTGGGAGGGGDKTPAKEAEKFFFRDKEGKKGPHWNLTQQIALKRTDPALHKELLEKYTPASE